VVGAVEVPQLALALSQVLLLIVPLPLAVAVALEMASVTVMTESPGFVVGMTEMIVSVLADMAAVGLVAGRVAAFGLAASEEFELENAAEAFPHHQSEHKVADLELPQKEMVLHDVDPGQRTKVH
jgi:hypothetical protein